LAGQVVAGQVIEGSVEGGESFALVGGEHRSGGCRCVNYTPPAVHTAATGRPVDNP
jgi:hypothetical protein